VLYIVTSDRITLKALMVFRVNCEDSPECDRWSRKQRRNQPRTRDATIKASEVASTIKESELACILEGSSLEWDENFVHEEAVRISELQDVRMGDEVAFNLGLLHSREEGSPHLQDLGDIYSETSDNWDLCETTSISSSWLDLQNDLAAEKVIDEEDILILAPPSAQNTLKAAELSSFAEAAKPQSFAEALARGLEATQSRVLLSAKPAPNSIKPNVVAKRMLKPIPQLEEQEDDHAAWTMYKSLGVQRWSQDRHVRRK